MVAEQVIAGLDRAVATMKKGEQAILTISHEYGYGNEEVKRDLAVIPPLSTLIYEVEMIDFIKVTYQQKSPKVDHDDSNTFHFELMCLQNVSFIMTAYPGKSSMGDG